MNNDGGKPTFKLTKSPWTQSADDDRHFIHWEMVSGEPFVATHLAVRDVLVQPGNTVSLTAAAFWP
jgi:hypothetical protein